MYYLLIQIHKMINYGGGGGFPHSFLSFKELFYLLKFFF